MFCFSTFLFSFLSRSRSLPLSLPRSSLADLSLEGTGQTNLLLPKLSILATNSAMVGGELNCRLKLRGSYITEGRRCSGPPSLPLKANSDPNLVINVREKRHEMGDIVKLELSGTIDPREDGHADRQTRGWSPSQSLSKVEASRAQWLGRIGDPPRPRSSYSLLSYSPFCCIKLD